jgi:ERCC4-related helicase
MVRPSGQLCLIDFGIARFFDEEKDKRGEADTAAYYTPGWSAPELDMQHRTTPRSDLFSLGVLLHYWLSGEQPDDSATQAARKPLRSLPRRKHQPLWEALADASEKLRHVLPEHRFADARELAVALKKHAGQAEPQTRTCQRCKAEARVSCRFCPVCGGRLLAGGAAAPAPATVRVDFAPEHGDVRDAVVRAVEDRKPAALDRFRVYQKLRELEQDPGFSELVSLESLPNVERLPHQVDAVKTALQRMRGWCLLADEVGLGKTIEAGLIIKELMQRQLARKILIIAPRDLCTQWQQELFDKFDLFFLVFGKDVDYSLAWQCDRVIAPYRVAEDRFHRTELLAQKFDLVVMDEAHHLIMHDDRRGASGDYRRKMLHGFAKELRKNYFLMLSATPLHDDLQDLYELLTLLKPGSVGDFENFKKQFMDPSDPYKPRNVQELRRRLDEVMIRRQRRLIAGLKFPRRDATRMAVTLRPDAATLFAGFRRFVKERLQESARENRSLKHALQVLAESFHSSPAAFASQCSDFLRRFRALLPADVPDQLGSYQSAMNADMLDGKVACAARVLGEAAKLNSKVLVFTQYEDTADLLAEQLARRTGLSVVRYPSSESSGGGVKALEALHQFRESGNALICTENASEGLNLQIANTMINFDLPWDPMKLEQRIGRVQRLGQVSDRVYIHNLFLADTVEQDILDVLEKKIEMFSATVGHVEEILGNLADDRRFDQVFLDLFLEAADVEQQIDGMVTKRESSKIDELLNGIFQDDLAPAAAMTPTMPLSAAATAPACRHCRQPLPPLARFCDNCGTLVETPPAAPALCACGKTLEQDMRFCDNCGRRVLV